MCTFFKTCENRSSVFLLFIQITKDFSVSFTHVAIKRNSPTLWLFWMSSGIYILAPNTMLPLEKYLFQIYDLYFNHFFSASDNRTRRKSEPTAAQSRPQSSLSSNQSIGKPSEIHAAHLPEPTSTRDTQRKPINTPSTSSLSRSKGRCQTVLGQSLNYCFDKFIMIHKLML